MKIKRFYAATMREAIRMVREEQGADAVILSNQTTPNGIEIVAAVDYDASLLQQMHKGGGAPAEKPAQRRHSAAIPTVADGQAGVAPQLAPTVAEAAPVSRPRPRAPVAPRAGAPAAPAPAPTPAPITGMTAPEMQRLQREILFMREMLERQTAGMMWGDMQRTRPGQAAAFRALAELGLEPALAREIAEQLPEQSDAERARFLPLGLLGRRIPTDASDPILAGGIVALVGPTGVGKTTTIAKLAARWAAQHGTRDLALVTTDHYRVGAQEQLYTYGRLLGAPVYAVGPSDRIEHTLERLSDRKLVLIDTAGVSQRDRQLGDELARLASVADALTTYLVLASNAQIATQEEAVTRFGKLPLAGCILTKLDEADRAGGSLSIAIRRELPVAYYADGQRVPEDLHVARADRLVLRAMQLARRTPGELDETLLASGFAFVNLANG
jgi:flagellar biosynthesis protein FlhF